MIVSQPTYGADNAQNLSHQSICMFSDGAALYSNRRSQFDDAGDPYGIITIVLVFGDNLR